MRRNPHYLGLLPICRSYSTAIYFLMATGNVSSLHVLANSEVWHFYRGDPLTVVELDPQTGIISETTLGVDFEAGQIPQHVVRPHVWFGAIPTYDLMTDRGQAMPAGAVGYSLVGCTVAPGFDFADFELAKKDALIAQFPQHAAMIAKMCRVQ